MFDRVLNTPLEELDGSFGKKYSRMDQVIFVEDSLSNIWRDMVCESRPYPFKFLKGCLPQIVLGPFLNTWSRFDYGKDIDIQETRKLRLTALIWCN